MSEEDRRDIDADERARIIEFLYHYIPVPEKGIYEGKLRYYAASLEWATIIEGWIDWLATIGVFENSEDDNDFAIQQILIFEEGIDMETDIYNGIYKAVNDIAKQIVSGGIGGFSVAEDGTVTVGTGTVEEPEIPEDDTSTPIDESLAARYGAMAEIAYHIEQVFDKIDTLYGATNGTPATSEADAFNTMIIYFDCDQNLMSTAVTAYYAFRASNPRILFDGAATFPQYLYCNGYDVNTINKYMLDVAGYTIPRQNVNNKFLIALLPEFFSKYFAVGLEKPNTGYIDSTCYPTPPQSFIAVPFASARSVLGVKANHRVILTFRGYVTDTDGDIQDAFWYRSAAGVLTRTNPTVTFGAGSNMPSDNIVAYNTNHVYTYTLDLPNLSGVITITMNKHGNITTPTYSANAFTIEFEDFGTAIGV